MKKVIFIDKSGTSRAPFAEAIMKAGVSDKIKVESRGLVVPFEEPMNQKAEAVLKGAGFEVDDYVSKQLTNEDFDDETIAFVMEKDHLDRVLNEYEAANENNCFLLSAYVGDELEIMDPYGGPLQAYGICFELLRQTVVKLINML